MSKVCFVPRSAILGLTLSGLDDGAGSMRSNASGIGSQLAKLGKHGLRVAEFRSNVRRTTHGLSSIRPVRAS